MKLEEQALALKRETPTEIAFALTHAIGSIFLLAGAVLAWAATRAYTGKDMLMSAGSCLTFSTMGLAVVLYRIELVFDLVARRFRYKWGFVFKPRILEGSFDELEELRLLVVRKLLDGSYNTSVVIALSIRGHSPAAKLAETGNLERTHALFKRLEAALGIRATDETDHAFRPEGTGEWELPEPVHVSPRQARIKLAETREGTQVALPRDALVGTLFVVAFFGGGFFLMGLLVVAAKLGLLHIKYGESPPGSGWFIGPLFTLIGGAFCWAGFFAWYAREKAAIESDRVVFFLEAFGRRFQERSLRKADIARVEIRTSLAEDDDRKEKLPLISGRFHLKRPSLRQEVSIESDAATMRIGSRLTHEELIWLRDYLRAQLSPRMRASGEDRGF
jgi:hypothetical protein